MAQAILANWVHPKRRMEATDKKVHQIRQLMDKVALEVLLELGQPLKYVCTQRGRQLDLELMLSTLDDKQNF